MTPNAHDHAVERLDAAGTPRRPSNGRVKQPPVPPVPFETAPHTATSGQGQNGRGAARGHARATPRRFSAPSRTSISLNVPRARPRRRRATCIPPPVPPLARLESHACDSSPTRQIFNFHVPGGYEAHGTRRRHVPAMSKTFLTLDGVYKRRAKHAEKSGGSREA